MLLAILWIAGSARLSAHRLDEFLQAARIAVEADRVVLELSLTPGTAVAGRVIGSIDGNGDGVFSAAEKQAYAAQALAALVLRVDEGPRLPMVLTDAQVPDAAAMRAGDGVIAIRGQASISSWPAGSHRLLFRNEHAPDGSVYLANALVPGSDEVSITAQQRDVDQRALTISFTMAALPSGWSQWPWLAGGVCGLVLMAWVALRAPHADPRHAGIRRHA